MRIKFTKAPTFTKAIIAAAVFGIVFLASTSSLPSCSDTLAALNSGGCIERQSYLHTASGWLALFCLLAAVLLLALKHKDTIHGWVASAQQQAPQEPSSQPPAPAPGPGRASSFCATCGTRFIAGDAFCQGCGASMGSLRS